ncbi:MAG: hypothetical protein Q8T08_25630, partial [Ignavibacteria bacterium]|nr:hypothetical protein [Ignavibacteria bacterium]
TYRVFEGYQSFSALITSFDEDGALLWSNDFEMRDVLSPQLRDNVTIRPDSTGIVAAMLQDGILSSKIIGQNGNQLGQTEQTKIENLFTNDRLQEENFSNISWWYDQYYIATGYQRIANNRLRTNNPRSVFYIQKLVFE